MDIAWPKVLPVMISIVILVVIALIREYSKTLAAITATMPVTIPLSLWIIYSAEGGEWAAVSQFTEGMLIGIGPTALFVFVVWLASRAGWGLLPMLAAGYAAWAVALGVLFGLRQLLGGG